MLRKSRNVSVSSQKIQEKSQEVPKKKVRFDQQNLRETHHPIKKDYGFMNIPEAKTPFPRHANPVVAEDLRSRLQEALDKANRNLYKGTEEEDYATLKSFNMSELQIQTPVQSIISDDEEGRHEEFFRKRKLFNQAEFIIAKQKLMSTEIPEPGPSFGESNRSDFDNLDNVPSSLRLFVSQSQLQRQSISINYETLREIVNQAKNYQSE